MDHGRRSQSWNHESLQQLPAKATHDDRNVDTSRPIRHRVRRLEDDQVDQLVGAFIAGATITQLVDRFKVHRTTVMAHLRRRGVPRLGEWSPAQVSHVASRYESGETLDEIAATLEIDPRTVGRQLRRAGVRLRPDTTSDPPKERPSAVVRSTTIRR
jgi:DNA-binding transcriptional ArsR family regulator